MSTGILSPASASSTRSSFRSARGFASLVGAVVTLWLLLKGFHIYSLPLPPAAGPPSLDGYAAAPYDAGKQGLGFSYAMTPDELEQERLSRSRASKSAARAASSVSHVSSHSASSSTSSHTTLSSTSSTSSISTTAQPVTAIPTSSVSPSISASDEPITTIPTSLSSSAKPLSTPISSNATTSLDIYASIIDEALPGETPHDAPLTSSDEIDIIEDTVDSSSSSNLPSNPSHLSTTIVVGRLDKDPAGVAWIHDTLKDITNAAIYIVDDVNAPLHLDRNKGREAMVYLKYILEHYDKLSDVTIFFHSSRNAWHNNVLMAKDGAIMINNLRRAHVVEQGYFNMRCELYPGCPKWIKWNPTKEENAWFPERTADLFSEKLWDRLFPNRTHNPDTLAQPCCSQFALSRDRIRSVPRAQYETLRTWLWETDMSAGYSGRVMEYVWQYLWLDKDEHCPAMSECYCKGYGLCLQNEQSQKVVRYNSLRQQMDEQLTVIGKWDREHCKPLGEGTEEKKKCKEGNPEVPKFSKIQKEKLALEGSLAGEMGILEP